MVNLEGMGMPELALAWGTAGEVAVVTPILLDAAVTSLPARLLILGLYILFLFAMALVVLLVLQKRRQRRQTADLEEGSDSSSATEAWRQQLIARGTVNDDDEELL